MKKITIISLFLLCVTNSYSKQIAIKDIIHISDSILLKKTNEALFDYFDVSGGSFYKLEKKGKLITDKFLSKKKLKLDNVTEIWVLYSFYYPEVEGINSRVWIKLDKELNLTEDINLEFIPDFLWNGEPCNFISKQNALKKGIEYFEKDGIKIEEPELYYDKKMKLYVYRVTSYLTKIKDTFTGKNSGETEVIIINALSGEFIERKDGMYGIFVR